MENVNEMREDLHELKELRKVAIRKYSQDLLDEHIKKYSDAIDEQQQQYSHDCDQDNRNGGFQRTGRSGCLLSYRNCNTNYSESGGEHINAEDGGTNNMENSGYGGGPLKDRRRGLQAELVPDTHQIFVGNLPQSMHEDELRQVFETYGSIIDVRINIGKRKLGVSTNRKKSRPAPNFGFITFDDKVAVSRCLKDRPIKISGDRRLNVEQKKTKSKVDGGSYNRPSMRPPMHQLHVVGGHPISYHNCNTNYSESGSNHINAEDGGTNNMENSGYGGGPLEDRRRGPQAGVVSDTYQIFVGNLPQSMHEDELRQVFETYGSIIDVRINIGKKKLGVPSNEKQSVLVPNFGYITFDDEVAVSRCLKDRPIKINGEHRLNVEEKKTKSKVDGGPYNRPSMRPPMHQGGPGGGSFGRGEVLGRGGYNAGPHCSGKETEAALSEELDAKLLVRSVLTKGCETLTWQTSTASMTSTELLS